MNIKNLNQLEECGWNVIEVHEFKNRIANVFNRVSSALQKTLGPFGSNTIIEQFGEMHITKDGWNVLKKITFNNPVENNIMQLLLRIAAQVVIKVGDGTTSSIVAANSMLKILNSDEELKKIRPKDIIDNLTTYVNTICFEILKTSQKISKDNNYEEIYKLAK